MKLRVPAIAAGITAVLVGLAPGATASSTAPVQATDQDARHAKAVPSPEGGRPIFASGGVRCVLGFNVRRGDSYHFLTAGGCAKAGLKIYADPGLTVELGTVVSVMNVATALARYVDPGVERPGSVYLHPGSQDITAAGNAAVGQRVCRSSPTTGMRCGTVTAINQTVNFPEGSITGLTRTSVCAEPGDNPGAPYFIGTMAVGLGIAGSGNCSSGGTSYYQPISDVLSAFGVNVY
ncbi:S1 family peptidase [Actinomadura rubrisoli]|uniref:Streptogrisin B n=1 Tax=Actinomadura rubrisoli TaxID=2530368 RepID=A0A4R5BC18_9ACTN|nr:S1 family peptidase [Actinomadura rubrisoli]TDD81052.1 streptogrisin B precursor [Actinomadura rubrisoli]